MEFRVLGPVEVRRDGTSVRIGSTMQRRLLALLLVHAGERVSVDRVIDVLWHGDPPPSAPRGLHTYVSRLRDVLGAPEVVRFEDRGYRLRVEDEKIDARRFERCVALGRRYLADDPSRAAEVLAEGLRSWHGAAFGDLADEAFARDEAARLDELRRSATEDGFAARLASDGFGVVSELQAFVRAHPLRERPHAQLMVALGRAGRQAEALEVYEGFRDRIADELGLQPSSALAQLHQEVLRQGPGVAPAVGALVATSPAGTDDGSGEPAAGPAGVEHADRVVDDRSRGAFPRVATSFVGRAQATAQVAELLEVAPLVTLTGVGGVGKTRLALAVAEVVADRYPDGTWWCGLATLDPGSVVHAVAGATGVTRQAGRSLIDRVVLRLAHERALLVLDNCEHVGEVTAELIRRILGGCPGVTILATSRERLAVDGERVWLVPPLPLPSGQGGTGADPDDAAVELFRDRADALRAGVLADPPARAAAAEICRRLDGLPLAIELAAALVPALEPAQIAERLGHRFALLTHGKRTEPRHRSLTAVVEWSHERLDPDEQLLFARLAVFAGRFTLAAAEGVAADPSSIGADRVAGLLAGLVDRSMVSVDRRAAEPRYHLLETLRAYAGQRLDEQGEGLVVGARHARWFVALAERMQPRLCGPAEFEAVGVLDAELDDLRRAHRWAIDHDDGELALRLAAALYLFALFRLDDEVFVWAEEAAELRDVDGDPRLPTVQGVVAYGRCNRGDLTGARELAEQALASTPDTRDPATFSLHHTLAATALFEGRLDDCRAHTVDALAVATRAGDDHQLVMARLHEVLALAYGGRRDEALEAARALRSSADELDNPTQRAWALYVHAEAWGDEAPEQAFGLLERALALAAPVRSHYLEGVARVAVTSLLARHVSPARAVRAFPGLIRHWRRAGDRLHQWTTLRNLVPVLAGLGAAEPAALLLGAHRAAGTAAPVYGADAVRLDEVGVRLRAELGAAVFEGLLRRGGELSTADSVDVALRAVEEARGADRSIEGRSGGPTAPPAPPGSR